MCVRGTPIPKGYVPRRARDRQGLSPLRHPPTTHRQEITTPTTNPASKKGATSDYPNHSTSATDSSSTDPTVPRTLTTCSARNTACPAVHAHTTTAVEPANATTYNDPSRHPPQRYSHATSATTPDSGHTANPTCPHPSHTTPSTGDPNVIPATTIE